MDSISPSDQTDEGFSGKRRRPLIQEEICAFITPVKRKSSLASRSAFKAPFKSPLNSPSLPAAVSSTGGASKSSLKSSPAEESPTLKSRLLGGLSRGGRSTAMDPVTLQAKIDELKAKEEQLDMEIAKLEDSGLYEKDLRDYMNQLHDYNDLKDAAQTTFGRLANIRQCMIRDVYRDLGLNLDD